MKKTKTLVLGLLAAVTLSNTAPAQAADEYPLIELRESNNGHMVDYTGRGVDGYAYPKPVKGDYWITYDGQYMLFNDNLELDENFTRARLASDWHRLDIADSHIYGYYQIKAEGASKEKLLNRVSMSIEGLDKKAKESKQRAKKDTRYKNSKQYQIDQARFKHGKKELRKFKRKLEK